MSAVQPREKALGRAAEYDMIPPMSTKTVKTKSRAPGFRYAPEDLAPRDAARDDAFADAFIARNREALNASIKKARASLKRGEGTVTRSEEDFFAAMKGGKVRRRPRTS